MRRIFIPGLDPTPGVWGGGFSLLTAFTGTEVFNHFMFPFQIGTLFACVMVIWGIGKALVNKRDGASILIFGFLIVVIALINDILYSMQILDTANLAQFAVGGFTFCQSYLLAKIFSNSFNQVEKAEREISKLNLDLREFNEDLERQVNEKTKKVRALLDHIPQGVFSIGTDLKIDPHCSAHLKDVLGKKVNGLSFKDEIFQYFQMNSDAKDQAWNTIFSCLGEDLLNFEVNQEKLPTEVRYVFGGEDKYLKLTWNAETNENSVINSILVTVLDITQEKFLEFEAEEHRSEILKLQQLVRVPEVKAEQFFTSSQFLLNEIASKLDVCDSQDATEEMARMT